MNELRAKIAQAICEAQGWDADQHAAKYLKMADAVIEVLREQEPAGYQKLYADGSASEEICESDLVFMNQRPLYELPIPPIDPLCQKNGCVYQSWQRRK